MTGVQTCALPISSLLADMELYSKSEYSFDIPILLIWGENDQVVDVERGKQLADYLGTNARLEIIENAAHMPNMTHSKRFNQIVTGFLLLD